MEPKLYYLMEWEHQPYERHWFVGVTLVNCLLGIFINPLVSLAVFMLGSLILFEWRYSRIFLYASFMGFLLSLLIYVWPF